MHVTPTNGGTSHMVDFKLSNILLEHNERFYQYPKLFYRSANDVV